MRLKCVQTLKSLFAHPDRTVATPYIHTLAPRLVEFLYSDSARNIFSDGELVVTLETIVTVESLIELAEPQNRKYSKTCFEIVIHFKCGARLGDIMQGK